MIIFCEGLSLVARDYQDIRYVKDEDMVSSLIYANILNIEERLKSISGFLKMETDKYIMHLVKRQINRGNGKNGKDLVIYLMENSNINEKKSKRLLNKILDVFLEKYGSEIDALMKNPRKLEDMEVYIDKVFKKLRK